MTEEEKDARANDGNVKYIARHVCSAGDKEPKPYVFISYKSDDWETVLKDITYRLVKDYGLNIYFDAIFSKKNPLWTKQFPENMDSDYCMGILVFLSNKYATSYATLMELMHSQTKLAGLEKYENDELPIVTINLEDIRKLQPNEAGQCTGLGAAMYTDGTKNENALSEKKLFDDNFNEISKKEGLETLANLYKGAKLNKKVCSNMVQNIIAYKHVNKNPYKKGSSLDDIVETIRDAFGDEVFSKNDGKKETVTVTFINDGRRETMSVPKGEGLSEQPVNPREGYEFKGWFYVASGEKKEWDFEKDTVEADITLEAEWEKKPLGVMYRCDNAFLRECNGKFTMLEGSHIKKKDKWAKGVPTSASKTYDEWMQEKKLAPIDDSDYMKLTHDEEVGSMSEAAGLVKGYSVSGPKVWEKCEKGEENVADDSDNDGDDGDDGTSVSGGYVYTIFGERYVAENKKLDQGKLMYDAFDVLMKKHPDKAENLTKLTSVKRAENVTKPGDTHNAEPKYFRTCSDKRNVGANKYYVGASYGFPDKLKQINKMFEICGEKVDEFILDDKPLSWWISYFKEKEKDSKGNGSKGKDSKGKGSQQGENIDDDHVKGGILKNDAQ